MITDLLLSCDTVTITQPRSDYPVCSIIPLPQIICFCQSKLQQKYHTQILKMGQMGLQQWKENIQNYQIQGTKKATKLTTSA